MNKYFSMFILIFIGLVTIVGVLWNNQLNTISQPSYFVRVGEFSVSLYPLDQSQELLRISPFDDYYYSGLKKDHLMYPEELKKSGESSGFATTFKQLLTKQKIFNWYVERKNGSKVRYQLINQQNNVVKVIRSLEGYPKDIHAIGQSFVYCQDCIVVDQKKRMYFNQSDLTQQKLDLAQSLQNVPVFLPDNQLPNDVTQLIISDKNLNQKFLIPIQKDQEVFLDDKWRVIEVKTFLTDQKNQVDQLIFFAQ